MRTGSLSGHQFSRGGAAPSPRGRVGGRGGREVLGAVVGADEAIRAGTDGPGDIDHAIAADDGDAARRAGRIAAERDSLPDNRRIDLVHNTAQADGAVLLQLVLLFSVSRLPVSPSTSV